MLIAQGGMKLISSWIMKSKLGANKKMEPTQKDVLLI